MSNTREQKVAARYNALGYKVLRGGAPDFLMLKVKDEKIVEVLAVEVKNGSSHLTTEQAYYRDALLSCGVRYKLEVEE